MKEFMLRKRKEVHQIIECPHCRHLVVISHPVWPRVLTLGQYEREATREADIPIPPLIITGETSN